MPAKAKNTINISRSRNDWDNGTSTRCAQSLSHVQLFMTPWSVAHQDPLSQGYKNAAINILYMIKNIEGNMSITKKWTILKDAYMLKINNIKICTIKTLIKRKRDCTKEK